MDLLQKSLQSCALRPGKLQLARSAPDTLIPVFAQHGSALNFSQTFVILVWASVVLDVFKAHS